MFVEGDINSYKSFKIKHFFNKRVVKKNKDLAIKYLIYWTIYDPKWDRWYSIKDLNNVAKLI